MSEIKARLSLDSSSFTAGLAKAASAVSSMSGKITMLAAKAGAAIAAIGVPLSAGAFAVGIKNALDFGGSLADMSARTGVAVKDLVILGQAFENAGMGADQVAPAFNRLQKAMTGVNEDGQPTNKTFQQLGIDIEKLKSLDPSSQFQAIGQAISGLKSPAERAAAAMGIFGKSGGEMLALFRDPQAIATATQQVGAQAEVLQRSAAAMDTVSDAFGAIKSTLRGFFVGLVEPLLPLLSKLAEWLNSIAASVVELGGKVGSVMATAMNILINGFKQGKLGELAALSLKIGFGEAANYLGGILLGTVQGLGNALAEMFTMIFSGETLRPAFQIFLAIPEIIGGGILKVMGRLSGALKGALLFALQSLLNALPDKLRKWLTGSSEKGTKSLDTFITESQQTGLAGAEADLGQKMLDDALSRFGDAGKRIADMAARIGKAFMSGDFSKVELFNTQEWKDKLAKLASDLNMPIESVQKAVETAAQQSNNALAPIRGKGGNKLDVADVDQYARQGFFAIAGGTQDAGTRLVDYARKQYDLLRNGIKVQPITAVAA